MERTTVEIKDSNLTEIISELVAKILSQIYQ